MTAQNVVSLLYKMGATLSVDNDELLIDVAADVLNDETLKLVGLHKTEIIMLLKRLDDTNDLIPVPIKKERNIFYEREFPKECDTSLAQQRMLFMESLAGGQSYYNIPLAYEVSGRLNKAALIESFYRLVNKHDVLRTLYKIKDGKYVQYVCERTSSEVDGFSLSETDLTTASGQEALVEKALIDDANYNFDLEQEWPIRISIITLNKCAYVISINIHHIAADGWSARQLIGDISNGYKLSLSICEDNTFEAEQPIIQYFDYVHWQKQWQQSAQYEESKKYWLKNLKGMPQVHSLATDHIRPEVQSVKGDNYRHKLALNLVDGLRLRARELKTTPFVLIQSAFAALLSRYSGQSDIVFGTAAANRNPAEFVDTIGLFVNTLVLRHTVEKGQSFLDLVRQAKEISRNANRHQQFPFDVLVEELQPKRSVGLNPLVQIMLVMQQEQATNLELENVSVIKLIHSQKVSKFDLALHVNFSTDEVVLNWEYNTALFETQTITAMSNHLQCFIEYCVSEPEICVGRVPLIKANEKDSSVLEKEIFPKPHCVHRLFENQAIQSPSAVALIDGKLSLTYQELELRANQVAHHLNSIVKGDVGRIGLCMEKSAELIIGMLAIFKLGGVYVPLDPHYPHDRLDYMVQDSEIKMILTNSLTKLPGGLASSKLLLNIETLHGDDKEVKLLPAEDIESPAYIIYTSGSTGKPKGVLVPHQSLFYSLMANKSALAMGPKDIMPTIGSQAFGVSLLEILLPLISGAQVEVLNKAQVVDLGKLLKATDKVTVLHAVPSLMHQWLDSVVDEKNNAQYENLRLLLVGGEPVPYSLLKRIKQWRPHIRLLALYGMTESAVVSSSYQVTTLEAANTWTGYGIGVPHPNTKFYVFSEEGQQQPIGIPGELYIGGLSLASEYVNNPQATSEKFINNPFTVDERLYRTGDRVRLLRNGNYEFLGRVDYQVSLRGARIELGEIEAQAMDIDGVKQAVAHVAELPQNTQNEKTLLLYFTSDSQHADDAKSLTESIRSRLSQKLPDYMRPSIIQYIDMIPLNPNGKTDKNSLPQATFSSVIVEPKSDVEKCLLDIWKSVLQREIISVEDNFFEVGGHSLLATKLLTKIRSSYSISFSLTSLFESPTIRLCALVVENALTEKYAESIFDRAEIGSDEVGDELII